MIAPELDNNPSLALAKPQSSDTDLDATGNAVTATIQKTPPLIYKTNPPPSAELKYAIHGIRHGQAVSGKSEIRWVNNKHTYSLEGETEVLLRPLLTFRSVGTFDDFGVAPLLYTEKRARRSETNTHFHPEHRTISFSASTASYPRQGGEQDHASIVWQLAGIGRGDATSIVAGSELDIVVAGARDAGAWKIFIAGLETIDIDDGKIEAWHFVRQPGPGSYEQKLDIWLAPQLEWYPVRMRFTEAAGDFIEMSISQLP